METTDNIICHEKIHTAKLFFNNEYREKKKG